MQGRLFSILILVIASARAEAGCIEPVTLAHSTVGITRYFDDNEQKNAPPGVLGIRATGWFLSPTSLVTIGHVAAGMGLSEEFWKELDIRSGEVERSISARIRRIAGSRVEKIAVLELQIAFPGVQGFHLRMEPLVSDEAVVSLAYPGNQLRVAGGRFVRYGEGDRFDGTALTGMRRQRPPVLDSGALRAPVFIARPVVPRWGVRGGARYGDLGTADRCLSWCRRSADSLRRLRRERIRARSNAAAPTVKFDQLGSGCLSGRAPRCDRGSRGDRIATW
jgi:hypothetical protein